MKEGTTVKGSGTAPAGGSITISPDVVADAAGKSITITCTDLNNPPGCITPPQPNNLATWYTLDEITGPNANRGAGFGHPLNQVGSPAPITGQVGGALSFSGANYAQAANAVEADITTGNFSIDLWIRTTAATGVQAFLEKRDLLGVVKGYSFYLGNGRLALQLADNAGGSFGCSTAATSPCTNWGAPATSPNVADGNWHLIAVTVDRTSPTGGNFYVDGAQVGTFDPRPRQGSLSNNIPLRLGAQATGAAFIGDLDEVEIFNTVLTPQSIADLFKAGTAGKCRTPLAPIAQRKVTIVNQGCPAYSSTPAATGNVATVLDGDPFGVTVSVPAPFQLDSLTASTGGNRTGNSLSLASVTADATVTMRCSTAACLNPALLPNMIGWYSLDETSGPIAASIAGARIPLDWRFLNPSDVVTGKVSRALNFKVAGGWLDASNPAAYNMTGQEMSFDAWVRTSATGLGYLLGKVGSYELFVNGGRLGIELPIPGTSLTLTATGPNLNDNQWHLVVVTLRMTPTGTNVAFYIDGLPAGTRALPGATPLNNSAFYINRRFEGDVDEVEIFDRVLTPGEVTQLFNAGSNGKCKPPVTGTVGVTVTVDTNLPAPEDTKTTLTLRQGLTNVATGIVSIGGPITPSGGALQTITSQTLVPLTPALRYQFSTWRTGGPGGTLDPIATATTTKTITTLPTANTTYTAMYDLYADVKVVITGGCTVDPAPGWYKVNDPLTFKVKTGTLQRAGFSSGGGASMPLTDGQAFNLPGGGTIDVVCTSTPPLVCVTAPNGPMTWWPMDNASMPARDIGSLKLIANPVTTAPTLLSPGKVNNALRFNGTQELQVPYNPVFDSMRTSPGFTIDAWVKLDGTRDSGIILSNDRTTGLNGYQFSVSRARGPALYLGAYQNINGYETFSSDLPITDNNWHFVAVRLERVGLGTATETTRLTFWLDNQTKVIGAGRTWDLTTTVDYYESCTSTTGPCWTNPVTRPPQPIRIGGRMLSVNVNPEYLDGGLDELEFFGRVLSDNEVNGIYNAGAFGKCKPPTVDVIVNTSPAIPATVGIAGGSSNTGVYNTTLVAGDNPLPNLTAQNPVLTGGTYYTLVTPNPWAPAVAPVTIPSTGPVTYTARYQLRGYEVTTTGCPVNVGPTSQRLQASPLVFGIGTSLTVGANPPLGQAFQSMTVTIGSNPPVTYTTSPVILPAMTGPVTINAVCGVATPVNVTLLSNPNTSPQLSLAYLDGSGVPTVGPINGTGGAPPTMAVPTPGTGQVRLSASASYVLTNTGYRFREFAVVPAAPPALPTASNPATVPAPTVAATYTAQYDVACYLLNVTAGTGGSITANPASGGLAGFPTNCYAPNTVVTLTATANTGSSFTNWTGDATGTTGTTQVTMNGPKNVTANFGAAANVTLTLVAKPTPIGSTVSITRVGGSIPLASTGTDNTSITLPPTGSITLGANTPVTAAGVYYQLQNFTVQGATTAVGPTLPVPPVSTTYNANYEARGFVVTLTSSGGCTVSVTSANMPAIQTTPLLIYPFGATINLTATAPSGQIVRRVALIQTSGTQNFTGNQQTLNVSIGSISQPTTVTPTCAAPATSVITVNTNPAGLGIPVGINGVGSAPNSYFNSVPAASPQALSAPATFVTAGGLGYRFASWSPAGPPAITAPASGSITYTANYTLVCHLVQVQTNPINTGTPVFTPASGGHAGFPAQCYTPGTSLTLSLTPIAGRLMTGWSPHSGGPGQTGSAPYTFTMTGPTNIVANTAAASPSVNWLYQSRTGGNLALRAVNNGTAAAANVRILSVSNISNGFTYSGTALPWNLTPSLPAAGAHSFAFVFSRASGPATDPFSFTITVEVAGGPPTNVTINVP